MAPYIKEKTNLYVFFVVSGHTLKCAVEYMAAYIKENPNNHPPLSVCLYACHMCKSEGGLYVNVKLHFLSPILSFYILGA